MARTDEPGRDPAAGWLGLPRAVWRLGYASLFTDTATEAAYPLLPLFLSRVLGAGALSLGLIEGVAEATNSILKVASGFLSDRWKVRRPIVIAGYSLSSAIRPLMAIVASWPQLLVIRLLDRVGKGVRGAPRDAMLAAWATPRTRGRVFGVHRAMDHVGAIAGPLLAALFLYFLPGHYRTLFALTIIPGVVAVWVLFTVEEKREDRAPGVSPQQPRADAVPPARLPRRMYAYLGVFLLFTLGNSSDAFLLLRFSDLGVAPLVVPLLWAALHVVKALASAWGGYLSDRVGRRLVIASGWVIYALVYAGFAAVSALEPLVALFLAYGLYYGLTEGTEKALIADLAPAALRGTAFGVYNAAIGIGALAASVLFGALWKWVGAATAFGVGAALALAAAALLFVAVPREPV